MAPIVSTIQSPRVQRSSSSISLVAFSKEFVEEAVGLLVTRFIPLNPRDIDAWLSDPEEWANAEDKESEQWEYELRVSAVAQSE